VELSSGLGWNFPPACGGTFSGCGFRFDPATHSDLIPATYSNSIPAIHSDMDPATYSDRFPATP